MVLSPTTRRAGRMNPAVRFTEASIHSIFHPMTSGKIPTSHLDRALMTLVKSKSALPRFLRELGIGELWFLTPFPPEDRLALNTVWR